MGSVNWDLGGKITTLFPIVSNVHLTFRPVMKAGKKVICGLQTPKMFVNFNKSHYKKLLDPKKGKPEYIWLCKVPFYPKTCNW